jgi:hypothetical protein
MSGHQYTQTEYALQRVVASFWNLLSKLAGHHLTHTYALIFHFCQLENIDCLVLRYLNTGPLPFEKYFELWLFDAKA